MIALPHVVPNHGLRQYMWKMSGPWGGKGRVRESANGGYTGFAALQEVKSLGAATYAASFLNQSPYKSTRVFYRLFLLPLSLFLCISVQYNHCICAGKYKAIAADARLCGVAVAIMPLQPPALLLKLCLFPFPY